MTEFTSLPPLNDDNTISRTIKYLTQNKSGLKMEYSRTKNAFNTEVAFCIGYITMQLKYGIERYYRSKSRLWICYYVRAIAISHA